MRQPLRWSAKGRAPRSRWSTALCSGGAFSLAFWLWGCAPPVEGPPPDDGAHPRPGEGCGFQLSFCEDHKTLWSCVERRWEQVACAEVCADRGGLAGCLVAPDLPEGRCWCAYDSPACTPAQWRCSSEETIDRCDPSSLSWMSSTCDDVCAQMDPPRLSTGCGSTGCGCTLVGTACAPGTPAHCVSFAVARCVDGVWTLESCPCPGTCDPWAPGGAACDCE